MMHGVTSPHSLQVSNIALFVAVDICIGANFNVPIFSSPENNLSANGVTGLASFLV